MWSDFDGRKGTLSVSRALHREKGRRLTAGDTKTYAGTRKILLPSTTAERLADRKKTGLRGRFAVVSRVMRKFDLALAEIYFRGRVHAPWLPSSGQGAKGQGRRYAARLALDAL